MENIEKLTFHKKLIQTPFKPLKKPTLFIFFPCTEVQGRLKIYTVVLFGIGDFQSLEKKNGLDLGSPKKTLRCTGLFR